MASPRTPTGRSYRKPLQRSQRELLADLDEAPMTANDVSRAYGIDYRKAWNRLRCLHRRGLIEAVDFVPRRPGQPGPEATVWGLTAAGMQEVER